MSSFGRDHWLLMNSMKFWILDENHDPVSVEMEEWLAWTQAWDNKIVRQEHVGDAFVSTVLLMLPGISPTFETMVFRDGKGDDAWQCHTWKEAVTQHEMVVAELKQ